MPSLCWRNCTVQRVLRPFTPHVYYTIDKASVVHLMEKTFLGTTFILYHGDEPDLAAVRHLTG